VRDNSPYREPGIDANRTPRVEIYDDSACAACGSTENLGVVRDDILCTACERKYED
jgi:hypothetical protein